MKLEQLLQEMVDAKASDVFIIAGLPLAYSVSGRQVRLDSAPFKPADTEAFVGAIYEASGRNMDTFMQNGNHDDDFSFALPGIGRFRANVFRQRGSYGAVIRVIPFGLPDPAEFHIPDEVLRLAKFQKGLVLVTGPAGAGKSTTLACIIDRLNHERSGHIITMEDPIEYVHKHGTCIVTQREVPTDVATYSEALRSAMRESPDVILLGEMRYGRRRHGGSHHRRLPRLAAATDPHSAVHGAAGNRVAAACAHRRRRHGAGLRDHDHEHGNPQPYSRGEDASAGQRHRLGRCRGHAHDGSELVRSREERTRSKRDGAAVQHPSRGA